ncbi:MAG TPA: riboflavin synthase [Sphingomicrobium sp.]|nr:riboflavin synthase [Sphingomicrobium sp.]
MFTGIVTDVGEVISAEQRDDMRLVIATNYPVDSIDLGASISCSGVCLTVVDKSNRWFAVEVSGETRSKTAAAHWHPGARVNLERALRLGDELGGHLVTGHVDAVGEVLNVCPEGGSMRVDLRIPRELARMVAPKGSLTVDGVSLTVNEVHDAGDGTNVTINIIPHTAAQTTLGELSAGQQLNVEVDVLARYLARMLATSPH